MNKTNLIDIVAEKADLKKKDAEAAVNAVFAAIEKDLKEGGKIQIAGFGSFKVKDANRILKARYDKHLEFITEYVAKKGAVKHNNSYLNCGVITGQEEDLEMHYIQSVSKSNDAPLEYECLYEEKSDLTQYPKSSDTLF